MCFLAFLSQVVQAEVDDTAVARQVVEGFQAELLNVMQQGDKLSFEQRFEQLKPVVIKTHNLTKITRIVVSKEWRKLTKEQKKYWYENLVFLVLLLMHIILRIFRVKVLR